MLCGGAGAGSGAGDGEREMRREYLRARLLMLEDVGVRYATGLYTGVDGERHFGFDVVRLGKRGGGSM